MDAGPGRGRRLSLPHAEHPAAVATQRALLTGRRHDASSVRRSRRRRNCHPLTPDTPAAEARPPQNTPPVRDAAEASSEEDDEAQLWLAVRGAREALAKFLLAQKRRNHYGLAVIVDE